MLNSDLASLLSIRDECLKKQITHHVWDESESARFHRATRSIVDDLNSRDRPVTLSIAGRRIVLHLTVDRMSFVELDPRTGVAIYCDPKEWSPCVLYRYPKAERSIR